MTTKHATGLRLLPGILAFGLVLCLPAAALRAAPPEEFRDRFTPEYEAMVRELMELSGERERLLEAIIGATPPIESAYAAFYKEIADEAAFASAAAREQFMGRRDARGESFIANFVAAMRDEFDQLAFDSAVQIYRELYSPEELRELREFLKSPLARKYYALHPQRMKDTERYAQGQAIHLIRAELPPFIEAERAELQTLLGSGEG